MKETKRYDAGQMSLLLSSLLSNQQCQSTNSIKQQELSSCWDGPTFGHNRHDPKSGGLLCPFP